MSNYDFTLDMETDNSNSLILRSIIPDSKVLEIGPAHGRMTKYLKEELNCQVTIVEMDQEAAHSAASFSHFAFVGSCGDVEKDYWISTLLKGEVRFDYIIFADVLEHLHHPEQVLKAATQLLEPNGSILISIPHVGYNGLVIDLLRGKFEYRDTGILDRTHLKFFTHSSLSKLVASCGLKVVDEMNAVNTLKNSEFKNSYELLPSAVGEYLEQRPYGEVYQFIWELKPAQIDLTIITPLYNKYNFTRSYLEDILQLDLATTEIILVDNGSTDETAARLVDYQANNPNLIVLRNEKNEGFGAACNRAFRQARGKHIIFLNNDIRVKDRFKDWTSLLVEKCTEVNLVSPHGGMVDENNGFQFLYETNKRDKPINYLSGWCLAGCKSVFDRLTLGSGEVFDPRFFCYFEDTDLSFRASQMGIHLDIVDIPVFHFGKVSSKQLNTLALYAQSKDIFATKWKNNNV